MGDHLNDLMTIKIQHSKIRLTDPKLLVPRYMYTTLPFNAVRCNMLVLIQQDTFTVLHSAAKSHTVHVLYNVHTCTGSVILLLCGSHNVSKSHTCTCDVHVMCM